MDLNSKLKNFLDDIGRVKIFPSKWKNKILILNYLASKFKKNITYSENGVNEILDKLHIFNDRCLLRRDLVNKKLLIRPKDCSSYTRICDIDIAK